MLTRSFLDDTYHNDVKFLHYLANEFLKLKEYSKALAIFYRIARSGYASDYRRSIAYIRIGEYFYNGNLTETPTSDRLACPKDLNKAYHYFQLGINICIRSHTLKEYAKEAVQRIERKLKVLELDKAISYNKGMATYAN